MFIIFAGLPGTGKSTIASRAAERLDAAYLRIDTIEQAIRSSGILPSETGVGPAGYMAAYQIAADNLELGRSVIADSVNPLALTREAYRYVAKKAGVGFLEVEVVCSDIEMHRNRVETRPTDVEGLTKPTWQQVETRHYEPWDRPHLVLDTAVLSVDQSVERILTALNAPSP
jgi:predicted kinase